MDNATSRGKEGGIAPPSHLSQAKFICDFDPDSKEPALRQLELACARGLPQLESEPEKEGACIIVGGGPSLVDTYDELKALASDPKNRVYAMNDAHDWLIERDIIPYGAVFIEIMEWPMDFFNNARFDVKYYVASMCHPTAFDRLEVHDVVIWHVASGIGEQEIIKKYYPNHLLVGGGCRPCLKTICLGLVQGFHDFHMFGCDASFPEGESSHAYYDEPPGSYRDQMQVWCAGRWFNTTPGLASQAENLRLFCDKWPGLFRLQVHGDGLMPHMHKTGWPGHYLQT